jgi:hypothetical protein
MGLGLVSGLNLYATVLTVGLGIRLGLITLNPEMARLEVLASPYVLIAAGILFVIEFFADKIPWVDSIWDSVHTFIRPLGAAVVAATAIGAVNAETAIIAALCAGISLSGHSAKAGTRLLANHSPEPFSNIGLSLIEDVLVVVGAWLALTHPAIMLGVAVAFLIAFSWFAPKAFRLMRLEFLATIALLKRWFHVVKQFVLGDSEPVDEPGLVRCAAGKGVKNLRHSVGHLQVSDNSLIFVTKRFFRVREYKIARDTIDDIQVKKRLLLDRLTISTNGKQQQFYLFKDNANRSEEIYSALRTPTSSM